MSKKVEDIIATLKAVDSKVAYTEGAFRYYIDNKIDDEELNEVLKADNYELPKEFFSMPVRLKKTYFTHLKTKIEFKDDEVRYKGYEVFNNPYFYFLAEVSRKSIASTEKLIDYIKYIGHNINIFFLGLQYIKIENTMFQTHSMIMKYCKDNRINNLYDLLISVYSYQGVALIVDNIKDKLVDRFDKKMFGIDINKPFNKFALLVECILNKFTKKEANTIKVMFHVLEESHLRDIDYYHDEEHKNRIINTFKKKVDKKLLTKLNKFIKDNEKEYDEFSPNGYSSIYVFLMEENHD